ncbi:MAG: hypothetical protein LIP08_00675 [Bacteroides sp.]|nr:hypothetical protein [Bacteroides sp.]
MKKVHVRYGLLVLLILLAAASRLLPHPANFAPIGAMALFGGTYFTRKRFALLLPMAAMWTSDLYINNVIYGEYSDSFVWLYPGAWWTYGAMFMIAVAGMLIIRKLSAARLLAASLSASFLFFMISNLGVWVSSGMYPHTLAGLEACYMAAIPFFKNTLAGDLVYSSVLFGCFELSLRFCPALRLQKA